MGVDETGPRTGGTRDKPRFHAGTLTPAGDEVCGGGGIKLSSNGVGSRGQLFK